MRQSLVMTLIGRDRPGLVESVAAVIDEHGGNWEESRMVQLAGEFAGLLRVDVPDERAVELEDALGGIDGVSVIVARARDKPETAATRFIELEVVGQEQPGIVHGLSRVLAAGGVNVEELETEVVDAPMSGEQLFRARARLQAPSSLAVDDLRLELEELAGDLIVEVRLEEPQSG